ncbi:MAG: valine--tRNA ligase [Chloroflexi bacterium]|nr:valine--tRNA ligase [Chloroflexota bacterium]|tara:strand:+ start:21195 stop:23897 length:2703 start_codon:yes stop_codon:yes gene_type:complete
MSTFQNDDDKKELMASAYDPKLVEERIYHDWENGGFFHPMNPGTTPFTVIMPPPNLTGELHIGHALTTAVQDTLIRWHRMLGEDVLWLPGIDHAAIAVNAIIERHLREENVSRHDIGRDAFLERVWEFVNNSRERIMFQHKRLGASADWSREAFTMDETRQKAVRATFKKLYDDGLIYRGERIINWDPVSQTAVSDLEVEYQEVESFFWHVRYVVLDEDEQPTDDYIVVATTRPETIPADTAVAVNPNDDRYTKLIGKKVLVPIVNRPVSVIADDAIEIEAGSGVLKVTPGHALADFEIGERHNLDIINLLNPDGTLNEFAGSYQGLDREIAREKIVQDILDADLIEKIEPYSHSVGHSERSGAIIEPLISEQWWIHIDPLAQPAIEAVNNGDIEFVPTRFKRTYLHWMENIQDWCISRQIWWGHRIPVWYCDECEALTVEIEDPSSCSSCSSKNITQDEDTLDTWFSSGLWPHSTLGWPDKNADDLKRFYPTQVMETGYDIIFFWVARMIMLSLYNMGGVVPFRHVYLHGLVRAADGSKMSKSRGNVVDPLESIERYGTDALRFALLSGTSPGNDQRITDERLEAGRNFANKLWNASRFVIEMVDDDNLKLPELDEVIAIEDKWILSRINQVNRDVEVLLQHFELAEALRQIRDFFWDEYADWYIEIAKIRVRNGDRTPMPVLTYVLDHVLKLLHPFMPFVTEEIWQRIENLNTAETKKASNSLIISNYPKANELMIDDVVVDRFKGLQDFIRGIRNIRSEKGVKASRWIEAYIVADQLIVDVNNFSNIIEQLARVETLHIVDANGLVPTNGVVTSVLDIGQVLVPVAGLFDIEEERERLLQQIISVRKDIAKVESKLSNQQFINKAPEQVVQRERDRLSTEQSRLKNLERSLEELVET